MRRKSKEREREVRNRRSWSVFHRDPTKGALEEIGEGIDPDTVPLMRSGRSRIAKGLRQQLIHDAKIMNAEVQGRASIYGEDGEIDQGV